VFEPGFHEPLGPLRVPIFPRASILLNNRKLKSLKMVDPIEENPKSVL
jgi:hypothetical protein